MAVSLVPLGLLRRVRDRFVECIRFQQSRSQRLVGIVERMLLTCLVRCVEQVVGFDVENSVFVRFGS